MSDVLRNPAITEMLEKQWASETTYGQRELVQTLVEFLLDKRNHEHARDVMSPLFRSCK